MKRLLAFFSVAFLLAFGSQSQPVLAQESVILVTSSGQALDAFTIKTLLTRANVPNTYNASAATDDLKGKKTLVIVFGASVKGFGAAGITAEAEMARTQALIDQAKADKIKIIGVHIGGSDRRGGLSEQFVKLVSAHADALVVLKSSDNDGFFANTAKERNIPLTIVPQTAGAGKAIVELLS